MSEVIAFSEQDGVQGQGKIMFEQLASGARDMYGQKRKFDGSSALCRSRAEGNILDGLIMR